MESCNVIYVLPGIQHGNRLHFAIDNVDFHIDIPDGKNRFQGTSQVVFQKTAIAVPNLILNRTESMKPIVNLIKVEIKDKPSHAGRIISIFSGVTRCRCRATIQEEGSKGFYLLAQDTTHWYLQLNIHAPLVMDCLLTHHHQSTGLLFY